MILSIACQHALLFAKYSSWFHKFDISLHAENANMLIANQLGLQ
jgi:hypothetical protein